MIRTFLTAAAALTLLPAAASAASYDFAADYGASVFSYGYGQGASFTAFTNSYDGGCFGISVLACQTSGSNNSIPYAGTANDGSAFAAQTITVPANTLLFHPGVDGSNSDAIVIFTAPSSRLYTLSGTFIRLDNTNGGGNGVFLSAFVNENLNATFVLDGAQFSNVGVSGSVFLNQGDRIQLNVGNNGEYTYDTTGLQGTISFVPEPGTWAMMIGGISLIGGAARRRQRTTVRFA